MADDIRSANVRGILVVVLLGLLTGSVLVWWVWHVPEREGRQDAAHTVNPTQPRHPPGATQPALAGNDPAARGGLVDRSNGPAGNTPPTADLTTKSPADSSLQHIVIRVVDESDAALPNWEFRMAVLTGDDLFAESSGRDLRSAELRNPQVVRTSVAGQVELVQGTDFPHPCVMVRLAPAYGDWEFAPIDAASDLRPGECSAGLTAQVAVVVARAMKSTKGSFLVTYADGVNYEGTASALITPTRGYASSLSFKVRAGESIEVPVRSDTAALTVYVNGSRRGFRTEWSFGFRAPAIPRHEVLVIPAHPRQTYIKVNCRDWPGHELVQIQVTNLAGDVEVSGQTTGGGSWETMGVLGAGNQYVVTARADSGVWRCAAFRLEYRQSIELFPVPQQPFTCRVRVLDDEGRPVPGALVYSDGRAYPSWGPNDAKQERAENTGSSERGQTGSAGIVTLVGLYPCEYEFSAQAKGFDVTRFAVHGVAGQALDAGDIVLKPAKASLKVALQNFNPDYDYEVYICPPYPGGFVAIKRELHQASWTFEKLAPRPYIVFVQVANGGRGINVPVEFDQGDTREIFVDVSGLRPLPPG